MPREDDDFIDDRNEDELIAAAEEADEKQKPKRKRADSPARDTAKGKRALAEPERNEDGEPYFQISAKRRATVRKWKSTVMVDLREFWTDNKDGLDKPGKKGISLSKEQWHSLKELIPAIDAAIDNA